MIDAFELDEKRSAGRVLVLPNPPVALKQPTDPNHYVAPEAGPTDQQVSDRANARQIADRMIATVPDELRAAAAEAYQASQAAGRALNAAQRELAALEAPAPAGMSVEQLGARRIRKLGIVDHIADLQRAAQQADQVCFVALDAARHAAEYDSGRSIYIDQVRQIREMREEAQRLLEQADHHQIALGGACGLLHSWLPTAPAQSAPVVVPAKPTKRGLFG